MSGGYETEGLEMAGLVESARAGISEAFTELVHRCIGRVHAIALARLWDRDAAEDVAQEVFLRALLNLDHLKEPRHFVTWLVCITRNLAADWKRTEMRASRLIPVRHTEDPEDLAVADPAPTPRQNAETSQMNSLLQQAVMQLPQELREVILLHYMEELSQVQIAQALGVNASTVGRRMERALALLRVQMEDALKPTLAQLRVSGSRAAAIAAAAASIALLDAPARAAAAQQAPLPLLPSAAVPATGTSSQSSLTFGTGGKIMIGIAASVIIFALAIPALNHQRGGAQKQNAASLAAARIGGRRVDSSQAREVSSPSGRASRRPTPSRSSTLTTRSAGTVTAWLGNTGLQRPPEAAEVPDILMFGFEVREERQKQAAEMPPIVPREGDPRRHLSRPSVGTFLPTGPMVHPLREQILASIVSSGARETPRSGAPSREDRIAAHEQKIKAIIEQNRVEQLAHTGQTTTATAVAQTPPARQSSAQPSASEALAELGACINVCQVEDEQVIVWFYDQIGVERAKTEQLLNVHAKFCGMRRALAARETTAAAELAWLVLDYRQLMTNEQRRLARQLLFGGTLEGRFPACNAMDFDRVLAPALLTSGVSAENVSNLRDINDKLNAAEIDPGADSHGFSLRVNRNRLYIQQSGLTTTEQKLQTIKRLQDQGVPVQK